VAISDPKDDPDQDLKLATRERKALGVDRSEEGRETTAMARVGHHLDIAERTLLDTGVGSSAVQRLMRELGITRKRANKLLVAAQKRLAIEGRNTTRETRKNIARKRLEEGLLASFNRERAITYAKAVGLHDIKYVKDPDLRAAASFLERLIRLDGLDGELPNESKASPDVQMVALAAIAKAVGADVVDHDDEGDQDPDDK